MSISEQNLLAIGEMLASAEADAATIAELRQRLPGLSLSRCDAHDVADETPFRTFARCNLYLLDARDHCVRITSDPAVATGFVLSSKGADT